MKIYFAHSKTQYNTTLENEVIDILKKFFPNANIVNPNNEHNKKMYKKYGMNFFFKIVKKCDLLVFIPLFNGNISAGVSKEVKCALGNGIPVLEMSSLFSIFNRELTVAETRIFNAIEESRV